MRPLKITSKSSASLQKKEISDRLRISESLNLEKEMLIFKVMLTLPDSSHSIDYRLASTLETLEKLAEIFNKQPSKKVFERFCIIFIRRSLLALED